VFIGSYQGPERNLLRAQRQDRRDRVELSRRRCDLGSATVIDNTVYFSTVYHKGSYGLNAKTGKKSVLPRRLLHARGRDANAIFLMGKYVIYKFVPKK